MFEYRFPEYKGPNEVNLATQIPKIVSEVGELIETTINWNFDSVDIAMECMDVIHACETLLHYVENNRGVDLDRIYELTVKKNKERGYYDEQQKEG